MSDLDNFLSMLPKSCQDFTQDEFCGVIRVIVCVNSFKNWINTIKGINTGLQNTVMYIFDLEGNFITSAVRDTGISR